MPTKPSVVSSNATVTVGRTPSLYSFSKKPISSGKNAFPSANLIAGSRGPRRRQNFISSRAATSRRFLPLWFVILMVRDEFEHVLAEPLAECVRPLHALGRIGRDIAGRALEEQARHAGFGLDVLGHCAGIIGRELHHFRRVHGRMGREVHRMGNRLPLQVLDTQDEQFGIGRLVGPLGLAIAVELGFRRADAESRRAREPRRLS